MRIPGIKALVHFGFWTGTAIFAMLGWALYSAAMRAGESSDRVSRTLEVLQTVDQIDASAARVESAGRGFLLSRDPAFLAEREKELARMYWSASVLAGLTADNPAQQARLPQLNQLVGERSAILDAALQRLAALSGPDPEMSRLVAAHKEAGGRIQKLTESMKQDELRLLELRRADEESRLNSVLILLVCAIAAGVVIMIPGYVGTLIQDRARSRAEGLMTDMANGVPGVPYQLVHGPEHERKLTFISNRIKDLRGIDREAALADFSKLLDGIVDEDRPAFLAAMHAANASGAPFDFTYRVRTPEGGMKWIHNTATVCQQDNGTILWNGYGADVTESKRIEQRLREAHEIARTAQEEADAANRAKSTFLATMSHEIRTPMTGVLGMLELLSMGKLEHEQRTTIEVVRESGRSLLRIIDDILDFSKIEAGKLDVQPEPTSIAQVVHAVFGIYSGNASSKGLVLKPTIDPRISPVVIVDPLRLQQILNNLVSNAIKFTPKGSIEIGATLVERFDGKDVVRFTVKDTGIGITPENQERLFQPFAQAETDTTRRFGGTGLGLSICHRLAQLMGGSIVMRSRLGEGTTMSLTLPMAIVEGAKEATPATNAQAAAGGPEIVVQARAAPSAEQAQAEGSLVLVVDDHPINRLVLIRQMEKLGYVALAAENGVQGLEMWDSGRFALVVTDCNMPEMDGYELARRIRAREQQRGLRRTPLIACTANAMEGDAQSCFAAGMDDYLSKPIELRSLREKLARWLPLPPS